MIDGKHYGYSFLQSVTTVYQQHLHFFLKILVYCVYNLIRSFRKVLISQKHIFDYKNFISGLETFNSMEMTKSRNGYVHLQGCW
jgi:type III secretory pathway component EscS